MRILTTSKDTLILYFLNDDLLNDNGLGDNFLIVEPIDDLADSIDTEPHTVTINIRVITIACKYINILGHLSAHLQSHAVVCLNL